MQKEKMYVTQIWPGIIQTGTGCVLPVEVFKGVSYVVG